MAWVKAASFGSEEATALQCVLLASKGSPMWFGDELAPKLESTRSADDGEDNSLRSHNERVVARCRTHSSTTVATTGASAS
ncbi:Os02g0241525 [Oryza sativa Japonica Group]|uniref:Os02g0241525 protein n=1 Tax=Oryza sativa subsp. japonica TaxID=39947 RepID=A0A0P0VGW3_ORYSJ|nr:Os02g0241525 [Oryza sativa Japonica Group]